MPDSNAGGKIFGSKLKIRTGKVFTFNKADSTLQGVKTKFCPLIISKSFRVFA